MHAGSVKGYILIHICFEQTISGGHQRGNIIDIIETLHSCTQVMVLIKSDILMSACTALDTSMQTWLICEHAIKGIVYKTYVVLSLNRLKEPPSEACVSRNSQKCT